MTHLQKRREILANEVSLKINGDTPEHKIANAIHRTLFCEGWDYAIKEVEPMMQILVEAREYINKHHHVDGCKVRVRYSNKYNCDCGRNSLIDALAQYEEFKK